MTICQQKQNQKHPNGSPYGVTFVEIHLWAFIPEYVWFPPSDLTSSLCSFSSKRQLRLENTSLEPLYHHCRENVFLKKLWIIARNLLCVSFFALLIVELVLFVFFSISKRGFFCILLTFFVINNSNNISFSLSHSRVTN